MTNPLAHIPAKVRFYLYVAYFVAGVILGAVDVWGSTQLFGAPLENYLRVYAYLGLALGFTAASNMTSADRPRPAIEDNPLRPNEHGYARYPWWLVVLAVIGALVVLALLL